MTKYKYKIILSIFCYAFVLAGCTKSPNYPNTPQIELVEANKFSQSNGNDSLHVKLKFTDGDGNLGMNDNDSPTQEYSILDTAHIPYYLFNCQKYITTNGDRDTFEISRNVNYFNFFVNFYRKNADGSYTLATRPNCQQNNGRFSRFDPDNNYAGPLEGTIEWNLKGSFSVDFRNTTVQIGISIQDRALNKSNEVRTQDIKF